MASKKHLLVLRYRNRSAACVSHTTTPSQAFQVVRNFAKPMKEVIRHLVRLNLYLIAEVWPLSWMAAFYGTNFSIIAIGMFYVIDFRRLF